MIEPPYRTIGVASTFSPRFVQVLAEAKRIRERLGSRLELIYVGKESGETARKFGEVFHELALPADSAVHYQPGDDPAAAILEAAKANSVDLIVAGALEKEVVLRPFVGHVARRLVRQSRCSVMLFTKPDREPKPLRRIVFMAEYSRHGRRAFKQAVQLAAMEGCERLYVVRVYTSFDEARAAHREDAERPNEARTLDEEEAALEEFIDSAGATEVPMEARCIRGNTGYAGLDFIQSIDANLLVVPIELSPAGKELPAHIGWITETIPCNLWVVR